MYYERIYTLVKLMKEDIEDQSNPKEGKVFLMYDWSEHTTVNSGLLELMHLLIMTSEQSHLGHHLSHRVWIRHGLPTKSK